MCQLHWGFTTAPFSGPIIIEGEAIQESLARLDYLVDHRQRLGIVLGDSGTGKTTLLEAFASRMRTQFAEVCSLNLVGLDTTDFILQLADRLAIQTAGIAHPSEIWREVLDRIWLNGVQHRHSIFLFDDVDDAETAVITSVVRLAQSHPNCNGRLTVVATTSSDRVELIGSRLLELADLRIDLWPWSREETASYIRRSLSRAGRNQPVFEDRALERMYELTEGNPRRVRQLAELALLAGAGEGLEQIDAAILSAVSNELSPPALNPVANMAQAWQPKWGAERLVPSILAED